MININCVLCSVNTLTQYHSHFIVFQVIHSGLQFYLFKLYTGLILPFQVIHWPDFTFSTYTLAWFYLFKLYNGLILPFPWPSPFPRLVPVNPKENKIILFKILILIFSWKFHEFTIFNFQRLFLFTLFSFLLKNVIKMFSWTSRRFQEI